MPIQAHSTILDTRPSLKNDLPAADLEHALRRLVERRVAAEMSAAAKTIKYRGPKTIDHIGRQSRHQAARLIADIAYNATNPEYEIEDPHQFLLGQYVEEELLRQYEKGIVSLAERANCPLMWSHYGDQHHGVCIGYSMPADVPSSELRPIASEITPTGFRMLPRGRFGSSSRVRMSSTEVIRSCAQSNRG